MRDTITEYIRDEKNNPRGIAVAVRQGDEVFYGYSLHNPVDKYSKTRGLQIALNRAAKKEYDLPDTPERFDAVIERYKSLEKRALKYFKDIPNPEVNIALHIDTDKIPLR
jgi:hypothetical protein